MKKVGFYHSRDFDGFASGAIMRYFHPDIELHGYDHGQTFDLDLVNGNDVFMADISLPMAEMSLISSLAHSFTWIDHHISAIKEYEKTQPDGIKAVLNSSKAACEVMWEYATNAPMPRIIELLGKYDTWRKDDEWDVVTLPFQYGMRLLFAGAEDFPMHLLHSNNMSELETILDAGRIALKYQEMQNAQLCKMAAFESNFDGLRAICLNGGKFNSQAFESIYDEFYHDIMIPFMYNGKFWTVSLYTTKDHVDCSDLARSYGGGGHKKAAGFQTNDISLIINKEQ